MANNSDFKKPFQNAFDLLPNVFKSDVNRALFDNGFNKFLTKSETKDVVGIIGDTDNLEKRLKEIDPQRSAAQLQPLVYNKIGAVEQTMSFKDFMNELDRVGVDTNRLHEWGKSDQFNFAPPIDLDKISNFHNYYWLGSTQPQYITVKNRANQLETIIAQSFADNADLYRLYQLYQNVPTQAERDVALIEMDTIYPGFSLMLLERDFIRLSDPLNQTNEDGWDAINWDPAVVGDWDSPLDGMEVLRYDNSLIVVDGNKAGIFNITPDFTFSVSGSGINDNIYQVVNATYDDVDNVTLVIVTSQNIDTTIAGGLVQVGYFDESAFDPEMVGVYDANEFSVPTAIPNPSGARLQTDPWSKQNFWAHITDIPKNINVNLLTRADMPIIEYDPFLVMNEWSYSKDLWKYRSHESSEFADIDYSPSVQELHFIDSDLFKVAEISSGNAVTMLNSDNPSTDGKFDIGSEITLEFGDLNSQFEYYTVVSILRSELTTNIQLDRPVPRDVTAEFTKLHNIRRTSAGDDWRGVYNHWVHRGRANPVPVNAQQLNSNLVVGDPTYGDEFEELEATGTNTVWYGLSSLSFEAGLDLIRVYTNGDRLYGAFTEGYYNGTSYSTNIPDGEKANAIKLKDGVGYGVIRIEVGPAAQSDVSRVSIPVRVDVNDEDVTIVRKPLIEYRRIEQVKTSLTQYPLFDIFKVTGETAYEANSIWKFNESPSSPIDPNTTTRIVKDGKNIKFEQMLLTDTGGMRAYREFNNASDVESTLYTVWRRSDTESEYTPNYVDSLGAPTTIGSVEGDWEIPKQMLHNLEHENRKILGTVELNQHFKSIIESQPNPPSFTSDETKRWRILNNPDNGLGGTIKEFNGSFDTLISVVFNDVVNIPKLLDFAADQYEDSINLLRDTFEQNVDAYLRSSDPLFMQNLSNAIADELVNVFERNGIRDRVFGDSTSHNGENGVRGWMASLPMVGLSHSVVPKTVVDPTSGVYELTHHDGHVTSPVILKSVQNSIISRIVKSNYGESGLAANLRDASSGLVPGYMYYATDTKQLYRFDVASMGSTIPTISEGQYWWNTTLNQMNQLTLSGFVVVDANEAWTEFDLNELFLNAMVNIEHRLHSVVDDNAPLTYDIESIKTHELFEQYERAEYEKFVTRFGIDGNTSTMFSAVDAFTWNYSSINPSLYRVTTPPTIWFSRVPSTWYDIYQDVFGTRYPNIEPWVLQGYTLEPSWWDQYYASSGDRVWDKRMWENIIDGVVPAGRVMSNGSVATGASGEVTRYASVGVNITDTTTTSGGYAPDALLPPFFNSNYPEDQDAQQYGALLSVSPLMSEASKGYSYGQNGPVEDAWRRSVYYINSLASVCFKIDPMRFVAQTVNSNSTFIDGLRIDKTTERVSSHRDTKFHGEADSDGVVVANGLNQWFVNYIRYSSRDINTSGFRSTWVDWRPKLGYQTASFVDKKSLSISTEFSRLDDADVNVILKHTKGMGDKWIDALRVVVGTVGEHTHQMGVRIPTNKGLDWDFRIQTANPSSRPLELYGVNTSLESKQFTPRIRNVNGDVWNHYAIDRTKKFSYVPGTSLSELDSSFAGIQGLVNFIDCYVASLEDAGFKFNDTRYAEIDAQTSRTIDWQFEIERLIEQVYTGMSSDELPVSFLGPWNFIFADMHENKFVTASELNVKHGDVVQLATTGSLPVPFSLDNQYHVIDVTSNSFKLSNTKDGAPITISTLGHGSLSVGTYRITVVSPVSYHEVNPFRYNMVLGHDVGIVSDVINNSFDDIDVEQGVYDQYGRPLRSHNLRTFRSDELTKFMADRNTVNDVTGSQSMQDNIHIAGAHVFINGFEHVVLFNDKTIEGNVLFDEFLGASVSRFNITMRTQADNSFRPNVGGHYLIDGEIKQNIESSIEEIQHMYDVNLADENSSAVQAARELVGFKRKDYFDDMGITPKSQFLFHRGAIQHKGATKSVQAFINSRQFVEANVDEYWAYKLAEFGDAREQVFPEIKLFAKDAATDKLMLQFTEGEEVDDGFIAVSREDQTRWYNHPEQMAEVVTGNKNLSFETEVSKTVSVTSDELASGGAGMAVKPYDTTSYDKHLTVNGTDLIVFEQPCDGVSIIAEIDDVVVYQYRSDGNNTEYTVDSRLIPGTDCVDVMIKPYNSDIFTHQKYSTSYVVEENNRLIVSHVDVDGTVRPVVQDDVIKFTTKNAELIEGVHFTRVNAHVIRLDPVVVDLEIDVVAYALNAAASKLTPVKLIDYQSNTNVQSIPIWDPAKGKHYHISDHQIDIKSNDDPAHYNNSYDDDIDRNLAWYKDNVGNVWWDTTLLGYTPYHDDKVVTDIHTRVTQWGKQSQWSSVDLKEWVESPVHPSEYADHVKGQQSVQGVADHAVLKRVRESADNQFTDIWVEDKHIVINHFTAVSRKIHMEGRFSDGTEVDLYRNGLFDRVAVVNGDYVELPSSFTEVDYASIVKKRYEPTSDDLEFNPDLKDDGRLVQYKLEYKYTEIKQVAQNGLDTISTFYFWATDTATNHGGMTLRSLAGDLTQLPIPFVVFQNLQKIENSYKYNQSVFRGLVDIVNADARYKLRYTKDFTLRDDIDDIDSAVNLKNKHQEWSLFREKQKFNVPAELWNKMVEALIGRTQSNTGEILPVPSLDRVLFDNVNNTTHRFGLNDGQAFVDRERGITTVLAELQDPEYDLFPIDREEFFNTHSFDTADNIEKAMSTIYNTFLPANVNRIWFAVLHDGLADNIQYRGIIKTSWIQLDGVRLLDTTGVLT